MSDVESLLREFIAEHRAGGEADARAFVERVEGLDRRELAALIDAYLSRAPRREWDRDEYPRSRAPELVESLSRSVQGASGLWPSLLPRLRARARIKRSDLVGQLAERLGAQRQRDKVERYYHQMEQGLLPSEGVSDQVLEALAQIVGQSKETLRRAGAAFGPGGPAAGESPAFTRTARAEPSYEAQAPGAAGLPEQRAAEEDQWDEVDRLFRAG